MTGLDRFKRDVRKTAKEHKIKVIISKKRMITSRHNNLEMKGYFDETNKELRVATGGDKTGWFQVLLHESCHMDQYIEDQYLWNKCSPAFSIFDDWLLNKIDIRLEVLEEVVQDIIRLELDCERRVIEKIKKYNLDINPNDYEKVSNISLYLYLFSLEKKRWMPEIGSKRSIYKATPGKLKKSYKKIPIRLHRVLGKEYKTLYGVS
jgi:hypothetical protein